MLKLTPKQKEAAKLIKNKQYCLLEGGSRSGKTLLIVAKLIVRAAKYPGTDHLAVRLRFNHAKQSLAYKTFPDAAKMLGAKIKLDKTDWFFSVPTSGEPSRIWIGGLDDKDRTEKILGNEYATIFINEASQVSFSGYEILRTRLNPPQDVRPLMLIDYNPPSTKHWGYRIFHDNVDPDSGRKLKHPHKYGSIKMNPEDNKENLSKDYIESLNDLSEAKRKRFALGLYTDSAEGAIWEVAWIDKNKRDKAPDLRRLVVAVDPAVTGNETSDDTGIVIAGLGFDNHVYILLDATYHGSVAGWTDRVVALYHKYAADCIVAEVNNGGDLVESALRSRDERITYKAVRATRGKAIRAEPVADMYRRARVHHVGDFTDLEFQMTHWTPEDKESPNNMDALVWAVTFLTGKIHKRRRVVSSVRL